MLDDVTFGTLHAALNGLAERQRAISDNIANVNTPYFRQRSVAFEGALKEALSSGEDPLSAAPTTTYSTEPGGLTGNNVNLGDEIVAGTNTRLAYELTLRATGDRFSLIRSASRAS